MFRRDPLLRAAIQPSELIRWRFLKMTLSEQYRRNPDGFRTNFGKNLAKIALAGPLRSRPERHCEQGRLFVMRELLSLSRVPTFDSEDVIRRTVTCERCLEPGLYRLDVASGHFTARTG